MKQKKYGKKIINWHRPFRSFQLSQRYLRLRDAEVKEDPPDDEWYAPWDDRDPYWPYWEEGYIDDEMQIYDWIIEHGGWGEIRSFLSESQLASLNLQEGEINSQTNLDQSQVTFGNIEEKLVKFLYEYEYEYEYEYQNESHYESHDEHKAQDKDTFFSYFTEEYSNEDTFFSYFKEKFSFTDNVIKMNSENIYYLYRLMGKPRRNQEKTILKMLIFAPFWIRPLRDWVPQDSEYEDRLTSLIDHLFVRYPVPDFLYVEWKGWFDKNDMKWLCWFILFAQGGSLHRAGFDLGWKIPRKFQYYLLEAPSHFTRRKVFMYAEVMRLGGSLLEFEQLCNNPAFVIDPTSFSPDDPQLRFWRETVIWLSRHRNSIRHNDYYDILRWAMHEYTERERVGERTFSWRGRSLRRVLEASLEYRRQLQFPYFSYTWQKHGWDWEWSDESESNWSFIELTSGEELFDEGKAMHHCVSTYARRCVRGDSAIISLRYNDSRRVTIEINPPSKKIVQAKGPYNRSPQAKEQSIIDKWLSHIKDIAS